MVLLGTLEANTLRINDAITNGDRLAIGVTLSYVGYGSDKFWTAVWADNTIVVNFGRHGSTGQHHLYEHTSPEKAAAKMWALLRSKCGKGYAVADAAILGMLPEVRRMTGWQRDQKWIEAWGYVRRVRNENPIRALDHPDLQGTSPRTPTQGAAVLLAITSPQPDMDTLLAAAVAPPSERFLPSIVMSRPDAPEEAKFLAALAGTTRVRL